MGQFHILMELYSFAINLGEKKILGQNFAFFIGQVWLNILLNYLLTSLCYEKGDNSPLNITSLDV